MHIQVVEGRGAPFQEALTASGFPTFPKTSKATNISACRPTTLTSERIAEKPTLNASVAGTSKSASYIAPANPRRIWRRIWIRRLLYRSPDPNDASAGK
jgi:hypothetical protein